MSGHISVLSETVKSECFATQSANVTSGVDFSIPFLTGGKCSGNRIIRSGTEIHRLSPAICTTFVSEQKKQDSIMRGNISALFWK